MKKVLELTNRENRSNMAQRLEKTMNQITSGNLFILRNRTRDNGNKGKYKSLEVGMNRKKIDNTVINLLEATSKILNWKNTGQFSEDEYEKGLVLNAQSLDITPEELETNVSLFEHSKLKKVLEAAILINEFKEEGEYSQKEYEHCLRRNAQSVNMTSNQLLLLTSELTSEKESEKSTELI